MGVHGEFKYTYITCRKKERKKNINDLHKLIKSLKCRELLICIIGHKVIIEVAF